MKLIIFSLTKKTLQKMSVKKEIMVGDDTEARSLRMLANKFNNSSHSDCYQVLEEVLRYVNILFIYSCSKLN